MKTDFRFSAQIAKGIDERIPADPESADLVQNFTRDTRTNAWDNRIGYEKYFLRQTDFTPWGTAGRIDSLFIWPRHYGAQEDLLHETGGTLYFLKPHQNALGILAENRQIPSVSEPCSQYIPMGRWLIILNGYDRPVKWSAWPLDITTTPFASDPGKLVFDVGWDGPAPPPAVYTNLNDPGTATAAANTLNETMGDACALPNKYPLAVAPSAGVDEWTINNNFLGGGMVLNSHPSYFYKVSFINNTGSESPVSGSSVMVSWLASATAKPSLATMVNLPLGPPGTVARRIYRTNNQVLNGNFDTQNVAASPVTPVSDNTFGDGIFRYVGQIDNNIDEIFIDTVSDSELGRFAPTEADSIPFPCPMARFGAVFKSCLFLDGGASEDARLYWSNPGSPDSFSALSFVDLSGRPGGAVTGLYSYYNMLIIFREGCIDIAQGNFFHGFQISTIRQGVVCRSPETVATVPKLGVIFLAEDGLYLISGGIEGGSELQIDRITNMIQGTVDRINKDALARAVGVYSAKWREYHCYVPADGEDVPKMGIVFHVETMTFSLRSSDFPVGAIDVNLNGDIIFGHHTGYTGSLAEAGLFAISRARQNGYVIDGGEVTRATPVTSIWRSIFHDFGRPEQKKFVKYVYLYVMTTGSNTVAMEYMKDFELTGNTTSAYQMQMPDRVSQEVWDTALVDTARWDRPRVTEIRYPIADGACSHFQFQISTSNDFVLVGYAIDYQVNATKTIRGRK
tara:strand:- start:16005 stop:18215 length:2211 start_codon:yes stop_codon:yes gene_type:complete